MAFKERLKELLNNAKEIVSSDPEESLRNVLELYSELKESNDYESIGKICKLIGTIYLKNGQTLKAHEYYLQGIANFKLVNNYGEMGNIYNNLIIVSYYLKTYEKTEEFSRLALQNFEKAGEAEGVISITNNLAKYYRNIGAFDKAYSLLKKIISNYERFMTRESRVVMFANYANVSINLGHVDEGVKILTDLSEEVEEHHDKQGVTLVNLYLTEYYESIGDYKSALACHKKRFNSAIIGRQEDISSDLNRYLSSFNIDIDRLQYDRMVKQNEELVQAHNVVSQKNGFLETLINTIPLPLFYCDFDYYYLGCNDAYSKYFQTDKQDLIGKKVRNFLLNENESKYLSERLFDLKEHKKPVHFIAEITRFDNDRRTIELFLSLFYGKDGEIAGILGMIKDITQEKKQQYEIKELNAHLKSMLESASQVYICSINRDYQYKYFNKNYADSIKRHIGKTISQGSSYFERYQNAEEIVEKQKLLERVFSGELISGVREYDDVSPHEILQYFYSPIIEEDGKVIGVTVFSYDITERVLAQRELARSNKTKDKFFSIIAHDLRSPIGNIKSALEFITTEEELPKEEVMELLGKLTGSAINTYDLLENLLQWSLTQRGLLENNSTSYWLSTLIDDAIKLSHNMANSKSINIEVICARQLKVFADKNMFFTILRNLLNNAIKYSYEDSTIIVKAESDDKYILIKIIDQGVGIKPEVIPYLNQMDKTVTTFGTSGEVGSGLGLVLCHELVEKLGGKIWIESEEGKGSTFSFTFPVHESY